jgi:hypothetical protein
MIGLSNRIFINNQAKRMAATTNNKLKKKSDSKNHTMIFITNYTA